MKYYIHTYIGNRAGGHCPYGVSAFVLPIGETDNLESVYRCISAAINKHEALKLRTALKRECKKWIKENS